MSSIIDVSGRLGEYMLKGWILSDETCPRDGCAVPLMRSPRGHVPPRTFCANCDISPDAEQAVSKNTISSPSITHSSVSGPSRTSTPPTELSNAPSSPTFALPVDSAESIRRRQQSDTASAEIGKRLLKGWAMLADECPNEDCYGIPLVRPPRASGRDPRKECVICHRAYVSERDAQSLGQQAPGTDSPTHFDIRTASGENENTESYQPNPPSATLEQSISSVPGPSTRSSEAVLSRSRTLLPDISSDGLRPDGLDKIGRPQNGTSAETQSEAVMVATTSLEHALRGLSHRMESLTSNPSLLDPGSVAATADAMGKVLQALVYAKQLHR